jgi:hypothetical protein
MKNNVQTVGAAAYEILRKGESSQGVVDTQREMQKGYLDELIKCAKRHEWREPFYLCVITKKERIMQNVIRNYFFARQTRPAPDYNMALYKYDPIDECISFEWVLPDPESVDMILENAAQLPKEQNDLIDFCVKFRLGVLI